MEGGGLAVQGAIGIGLLVGFLLALLWGKLDQIINPKRERLDEASKIERNENDT